MLPTTKSCSRGETGVSHIHGRAGAFADIGEIRDAGRVLSSGLTSQNFCDFSRTAREKVGNLGGARRQRHPGGTEQSDGDAEGCECGIRPAGAKISKCTFYVVGVVEGPVCRHGIIINVVFIIIS